MNEINREKLGNMIAKIRRMNNLSREAMGELLHVSERTIRRWEKGELVPTMDDVLSICKEFDISLEEFFEGEFLTATEKQSLLSEFFDTLGERIEETEDSIIKMNNEINELKKEIIQLRSQQDNDDSMTWFYLLIVHLAATMAGFISFYKQTVSYRMSFIITLMYVLAVSIMMYRNRKRKGNMRMFLLYSTFLACNLLFNYIISNKLFDSYFDFPNMLVVFVNGAMHGFRVFGLYEFKQFTVLCLAVYILWAVFCLYQYVKIKKENTESRK